MADIIFPGETPESNLGVSRLPDNLDLTIWQGDAQEYFFNLEDGSGNPINLTGCTAQATIRQDFNAPTSYDFDCTIIDAVGGQVRIYMSSPDAELIPGGDYIWNFQITSPGGDVRTYLAGDVKVYSEVD